jgi:hypothetical protein
VTLSPIYRGASRDGTEVPSTHELFPGCPPELPG